MSCYTVTPVTEISLCDFLARLRLKLEIRQRGFDLRFEAVLTPSVAYYRPSPYRDWVRVRATGVSPTEVCKNLSAELSGEQLRLQRCFNRLVDTRFVRVTER